MIFVDKGFIGTKKYLPGTIVMVPHKRKKGKLTRQQKSANKLHFQERVPSEHANRRIKVFRQVVGLN